MLTEEQKVKYIKDFGLICPYCDSDDLENQESVDFEDITTSVRVKCLDCKKEWNDIITLTAIEDIEEEEYEEETEHFCPYCDSQNINSEEHSDSVKVKCNNCQRVFNVGDVLVRMVKKNAK